MMHAIGPHYLSWQESIHDTKNASSLRTPLRRTAIAETVSWTRRFGRPTRVSREMHFDALVYDPLRLTGELDFWTSAFELFVAGIRSWESGLRLFLGIGG